MHAFVGADRERPLDGRERVVTSGRQRLLDQGHAGVGAGGEIGSEFAGCQASLASTISSAAGAARRTAAMRAGSPWPPSLTFRSGRARGLRCGLCHVFRARERNRIGGHERLRRRKTGERVGRLPVPLGFEIEQRAVERIAGGARLA